MTPTASSPEVDGHDVVVVGARCAGAATALLLARQGHDVVLVDRSTFPSDTLSTHSLARGGMVQLHRWGLLDRLLGTGAPPIHQVTFHQAGAPAVTRRVKDRAGVDFLLAPRRHVLDALLVDAAIDAGATLHQGIAVTGTITDDGGRTVGITGRDDDGRDAIVRARVVVGADGRQSRIARAVGARALVQRPASGSMLYAYVAQLDAEGFEFHTAERAFAGLFSTHRAEANVWI